jgi:polysaccharide pyruvyl transferase WcaK-like protein
MSLQRVKKVIGKVASSLSGSAFLGLRAPGLLILPGDPGTIIGSRGDQAMLEVMMQRWRALHPSGRIGICTANDAADDIVLSLGAVPERIYMVPMDRALGCCRRYGNVQVMGADVMDGAYSPESSAFTWQLAENCHKAGINVRILGCSINDCIHPSIHTLLEQLELSFPICLRDPRSLLNLSSIANGNFRLTSDVAFLLQSVQPLAPAAKGIEAWLSLQPGPILGVNLNQHILMNREGSGGEALLKQIEDALSALMAMRPVSLLLLPHDVREASGDRQILQALQASLDPALRSRVHLVEEVPSASELKWMVGRLSGLLSGRMHLAIAALSQCVPTMCFSYQDKFRGLYQHFNLPQRMVLETEENECFTSSISELLAELLDNQASLREQIRAQLPLVEALSRQNFA